MRFPPSFVVGPLLPDQSTRQLGPGLAANQACLWAGYGFRYNPKVEGLGPQHSLTGRNTRGRLRRVARSQALSVSRPATPFLSIVNGRVNFRHEGVEVFTVVLVENRGALTSSRFYARAIERGNRIALDFICG